MILVYGSCVLEGGRGHGPIKTYRQVKLLAKSVLRALGTRGACSFTFLSPNGSAHCKQTISSGLLKTTPEVELLSQWAYSPSYGKLSTLYREQREKAMKWFCLHANRVNFLYNFGVQKGWGQLLAIAFPPQVAVLGVFTEGGEVSKICSFLRYGEPGS